MSTVTPLRTPELQAALAGHALFLDIDGTLLDLAPYPESVEVPPSLPGTLQRLSERLEGAIAFVSGRTLGAIDALFRPLVLPAVGVHGGQIRTWKGDVPTDERLSALLQQAMPALRDAVARLQGVHLENKGCALALHYRAAPERGREVLALAEWAVLGLGGEFGVLMGKCVVEIRPRHFTKGSAIDRLMREPPFRGRTPIFAGDDRTDEDAFEVVNRMDGISVQVGDSAPTLARHRLPNPDQLRTWLAQMADG
jgi:trehalose 6-phosphate phosphatase